MPRTVLKNDILLLFASFIWGTTFVAQSLGMKYLGPMSYNALRFALGMLVLLPLVLIINRNTPPKTSPKLLFRGSFLAGAFLFLAASFQQVGIQYTTAAQAGFITGLYIILVPILGLIIGHRHGLYLWCSVSLALTGLYLLSVTSSLTINKGDLLVLISALFWTCHILWISYISKRAHPLNIAIVQFATCSLLSFIAATTVFHETITLSSIYRAALPLIYGGALSVGIAFTIQIFSQRHCPPAHASIIMSMEAVFAALAGYIILHQSLTPRKLLGCSLMLIAMLIIQLIPLLSKKPHTIHTIGTK